ncbi:hypothetical protein cyc_03125 [Cyclospora cayetanensis]|uniref:Uncharacterized protein n=1 Tax=Cyclospora cayetanensis TaxID=88456 RepID=A0A1D3CZ50_9EIME|nr:hypothetical protein cyc_03125 [Cyclospora cayetanensis]
MNNNGGSSLKCREKKSGRRHLDNSISLRRPLFCGKKAQVDARDASAIPRAWKGAAAARRPMNMRCAARQLICADCKEHRDVCPARTVQRTWIPGGIHVI